MSKWKLEYDGGCKSWKKGIPYSTFNRCKGSRTVKVLKIKVKKEGQFGCKG